MDPLFWLVAGAIPVVWSMSQKVRGEAAWLATLREAARTLDGGGVTATPDGPRLTASHDGATVVLRVRDVRHAARSIATADVVLPARAPVSRLYVGWGVTAPPAELAHIPEVHTSARSGFVGRVYVRSDGPAVAERLVETQASGLVDLRDRVGARALEVLVRGGRLYLALHGPARTAATALAMVDYAARLRRALDVEGATVEDTAPTAAAHDTQRVAPADTAPTAAATGEERADPARIGAPEARSAAAALLAALAARAEAPSPTARAPAAARPDLACHLCGERTHAEPAAAWSRCLRCDTPYHTRCWEVATGCVATGCVETRALPL